MVKVHVQFECEACGQRFHDRSPASFCEANHMMAEAAKRAGDEIARAMQNLKPGLVAARIKYKGRGR